MKKVKCYVFDLYSFAMILFYHYVMMVLVITNHLFLFFDFESLGFLPYLFCLQVQS